MRAFARFRKDAVAKRRRARLYIVAAELVVGLLLGALLCLNVIQFQAARRLVKIGAAYQQLLRRATGQDCLITPAGDDLQVVCESIENAPLEEGVQVQ